MRLRPDEDYSPPVARMVFRPRSQLFWLGALVRTVWFGTDPMRARRVDLEVFAPFAAGYRAQLLATYSADDIERLARSSREHAQLARDMATELRYEKWEASGLMAEEWESDE